MTAPVRVEARPEAPTRNVVEVALVVPGRVRATVASRSTPGHRWEVRWVQGAAEEWSCDCPAFTFRHRCRHIAQVRVVVRLTESDAGRRVRSEARR